MPACAAGGYHPLDSGRSGRADSPITRARSPQTMLTQSTEGAERCASRGAWCSGSIARALLAQAGTVVSVIGAGVIACSDASAPARATPDHLEASAFVTAAAFGLNAQPIAYVSLPPGSVDEGSEARLRVEWSGADASVPLVDGGFDPIALPAAA